jgi:hypothetical protein
VQHFHDDSQAPSVLLISINSKAAYILHVSRDCSVSLYSIMRAIF